MSLFSVFELHVYTCPDCLRILGSELCSSCLLSQHSSVMSHLQPYLKFCQPSLAKGITDRSYSIHYRGFPYVFSEQQWVFLLEISQTLQGTPSTTNNSAYLWQVSQFKEDYKSFVKWNKEVGDWIFMAGSQKKKRFIINLTPVGKLFHTGLQI